MATLGGHMSQMLDVKCQMADGRMRSCHSGCEIDKREDIGTEHTMRRVHPESYTCRSASPRYELVAEDSRDMPVESRLDPVVAAERRLELVEPERSRSLRAASEAGVVGSGESRTILDRRESGRLEHEPELSVRSRRRREVGMGSRENRGTGSAIRRIGRVS